MRKLIYGINLTIDGCCDHTKGKGGKDVHEYFGNLLANSDLLLYGRKTFELMVPFWPDIAREQSLDESSNTFAKIFDRLDRVVVSRSLTEAPDEKTSLIRSNLKEDILKLKQQPGRAISTGGVDLPGQLIEMGLVDELHIVIQPVIAGEGRRLFTEVNLPESLDFQLVSTKTFSDGCVALRYEKSEG